ncbi:MAG: 6-carboxytetrahydropterin synthase [Phycisphaera sp.]|nr:MAG: 6-carboxytetrahydropterin synthase [Phycisphaera sp.]
MVELSRTVRANLGGAHGVDLPQGSNGHAGQPAIAGLGTYYEFKVSCKGEPEPKTGYLVNIKLIDQAVRQSVLPRVQHELVKNPSQNPAPLVSELAKQLAPNLPVPLIALRWNLSPTLSLESHMDAPTEVLLRQRYEFAAAHRLNVPDLSPEKNAEIFGKCNNPSGHGHNYQVEVCVRVDLSGDHLSAHELDTIIDSQLIERFDHKHLNTDTVEFAEKTGLNPSVENIARVSYDILKPAIAAGSGNPSLKYVTIWETPKTSCTYPA